MKPKAQFPDKLEFLFKPYRFKVAYGGRAGAKSWAFARAILAIGAQKKIRVLCAREIQKSMKDSVKKLLEDQIQLLGLQSLYQVLNDEIRGENGTEIIFAGLRHNIDNIKSLESVDICWVEEASVVSKASWDKLIPSVRKPGSEIWISFNPELEQDETYQRFVLNPPPNSFVCQITYEDNPWISEETLQDIEYVKKRSMQDYLHIYEGHCKQAVEGAIYAEYLEKAKIEERIGNYKYDDRYPVSCYWDLGFNDNTSIVFVQFVNHEPRIIYSYQNQFQKTPHYLKILHDLPYKYDRIVLPHDSTHNHAEAEKTWLQQVKDSFPNAMVYAGERRPVELRLEASKNLFDTLRFDKVGSADLLAALARYHFAIDPNTQRQSREPFHGPESNYADAFGYMALELKKPREKKKQQQKQVLSGWHQKLGM